ncbi:MAG: T9SS type A sorting domain-containing protein [Gemmatimonadetes bacterium]|nr:T9SS type A sorting domain-containing protein [Gemmatimonadota bacterium]
MTHRAARRLGPLALAALPGLLLLATSNLAVASTPTASAVIDDSIPADRFPHRAEEARSKARFAERAAREADQASVMTPNQYQFDVTHYGLDLTLSPSTSTLSGTVTTTAEVTNGPVATFDFNLKNNMTVSAATSGGVPTTFAHASNIVTVDLDRSYANGEIVTLTVTYSGNPSGDSFGWSSFGGSPMIWSLSEPFGAREWWPCKDHNDDKADSVDITITLPDNLVVASNGTLVSDVDNGTTRTTHWHTDYAMAPYLVSIACHPYTVFSHWYTPQAGGSPMEVKYFVYPSHFSAVQATYALTVPMIDAFAQGWGEYPFVNEKYGHAEFVWGGGMEHQTCTSLGGYGEDLISHELAHQWWGDNVTCADFHHIWLNEGFATWGEAYWKEQSAGVGTYRDYMDGAAYFGPGTIYAEDLTDFNAIFDSNLSYNKASWVVHMLRGVLGDTDFFAGLAHYRALYGGSVATTEQFRDAMEDISGRDLDAFFQQWIYGEYFPVYGSSWVATPGGIDLTIDQLQTNTGLFTMPIQVRVTSDAGTFDYTVEDELASQTFAISVPGTVEDVQIDPDKWILRQVQSTVTNPTLAQGILLVNGVDWATYGSEITSAYADSTFWNDFPITFWDTFSEPAGGYPPNVPEPLGHGAVPAGTIGKYSAVVWVGNNYAGDLADWIETPIESYLDAGGNVLLLTRMGSDFLDPSLSAYLGINTTSVQTTISSCNAQVAGLTNMSLIGTQNLVDLFSPTVGPNSTLLFRGTSTQGIGVVVEPPAGGTARPDGGRMAYIAGRPYRYNHSQLRANVDYILTHWFGEPYSPAVPVGEPGIVAVPFGLEPCAPNPFARETTLAFSLSRKGSAELSVYDVSGRLVRNLVRGEQPAGASQVIWDGRDSAGLRVAPGVYYVRLHEAQGTVARPVVLIR